MLGFGKTGNDRSWIGYAIVIVLLHVLGFVGLSAAAAVSPSFWAVGLLAYTLGLRHAFDADHIAAIDNTVRKLVEQRRSPLGVGFYFSLGHSSVVILMVLAIAFSVQWAEQRMPQFGEIGGVIGASVSGMFLVLIGVANLFILLNLLRLFREMREGRHREEELERLLASRGWIARLIKPFYRFISRSWHVYPLGFLFGLGFDTATEIGLLAIAAGASQSAVSIIGILSFPLLFAAGMSLMDTLDGMFMAKAYRWAFTTPLRKLYYNVTVTGLSVIVALLIGVVELSQVLSEKLGLEGAFWLWLAGIEFEYLGYALVVLFVLGWSISLGAWKWLKMDERAGTSAG
jgi:high-affinity nickel-transport protein